MQKTIFSNSKAATLASTQHANLPGAVSPMWVLESWKQNYLLLPSEFPPIIAAGNHVKNNSAISEVSTMSKSASSSLLVVVVLV